MDHDIRIVPETSANPVIDAMVEAMRLIHPPVERNGEMEIHVQRSPRSENT